MESGMNNAEFIKKANDILINVYKFWPVMFERGEGCYLYDTQGKEYLDFAAGIAVNLLGYNHPVYVPAMQEQMAKLHMGLCYAPDFNRMEAAEELLSVSEGKFDQVFFCSTGAEAVEGALKAARKWAVETKGEDATEVIYAAESFHGRTMGALSVNGREEYREGFYPMVPGMKKAEFNNLDSFRAQVTKNSSAIIIEPVQGEGGIHPASPEFIKGIRHLCDEKNIALIFDEVQCGMGRTGTVHAWQQYGVAPDLISLAKGLGSGFPVGAFMGSKKFTSHITPGSHGSTYGGNPMACLAVKIVLKELQSPRFLQNVNDTGEYLKNCIGELADQTGAFENVRGLGMMIAADYRSGSAKDLVMKLLDKGLVILACGENSIRFVPPLIVGKAEVDKAIEIIRGVVVA